MPHTYRLERSQYIQRPLEETFAFFADAANLERITPAFLNFHVETPQDGQIKAGVLIDYRLRLYGVPLRWRTEIEVFEPPRRFVDVQLRGPYRLWRHTHEFAAESEGTRMTDCVEYQMPLGPLGGAARALFVRRALERIFDHRCEQIAAALAPERTGDSDRR
ncbi:MAG: SRPBCC family protein [Planctomycetes bacterium]|nr:SRPBCC family protein [Planctomycetota bacterium]